MQSLYNGLYLQHRLVFSVAVLEINRLICVFVKFSLVSCPNLCSESLLSAFLNTIPPVFLV